jgi:hypothetical protein
MSDETNRSAKAAPILDEDPEGPPVLVLHRLICDDCGKPISSGSRYCEVRLPNGDVATVHESCMTGGLTP